MQTPGTENWVVSYTLTVNNPNAADPVVYDLSDTIGYPAGVTVTGVAVSSDDVPPGTINPAFDGFADTSVATGVTLDGGAVDVYTLTVSATVPTTVPLNVRPCAQGPGFGFYNQGTVTTFGLTDTDDACGNIPPPPIPTVDQDRHEHHPAAGRQLDDRLRPGGHQQRSRPPSPPTA